jgi:hypothetical protein
MYQSEQNRSSIPQLIKEKKSPVLKSRGDNAYYGTADKQNVAISLKIITAKGQQRAIHYHDIISPMDFDGGSEILLSTSRVTVTITGHNLDDLFDEIIQHRVMWVKELSNSFDSSTANTPVIEEIRFEED